MEFLGEVGGGWKSSQKLPARRAPAWTGHTNSAFLKSASSSLGSSKRSSSKQEKSTLGTDHCPPELVFLLLNMHICSILWEVQSVELDDYFI